MHLLHIDTSPRGERSHTRRLTGELVGIWQREQPGTEVIYLDIGRTPPPHIDERWIGAAFTPRSERTPDMRVALRLSDALVAHLMAADVIVLGLPMYNFSVPSAFKAYIDQIVRVGVTFAFEPEDAHRPYKPLVQGKQMIVVVATGDCGYESGGKYEQLNYVDPYIRAVFGFIGIERIRFVHVGNDEFGGSRLAQSVAKARADLADLVTVADCESRR